MNAVIAVLNKVPKWVWVVLGIALVLLVAQGPIKRAFAALKRLTMKDGGDYGEGFTGDNEAERKKEIEALAQEAYNQLNAGVTNPMARERALQALVALNDTELRWAAKHYKLLSRDRSLYEAVDAAWMALSNVDETLLGRLSNIAMI